MYYCSRESSWDEYGVAVRRTVLRGLRSVFGGDFALNSRRTRSVLCIFEEAKSGAGRARARSKEHLLNHIYSI